MCIRTFSVCTVRECICIRVFVHGVCMYASVYVCVRMFFVCVCMSVLYFCTCVYMYYVSVGL